MKATTYISLLRGINVSGQKKINMLELKALYEKLDFGNVETYIQSGNVVFTCEAQTVAHLAEKIEAQLQQTFGYSMSVIIRTVQEFGQIIAGNPFTKESDRDYSALYVTFLSELPHDTEQDRVLTVNSDGDEFVRIDQEIYLYCPNGYGRTKLNNTCFERIYKLPASTRNWNTVNALYGLAGEK